MADPNISFFDVTEDGDTVTVRLVSPQVINDQKMEVMAQELNRIAARLSGRVMRIDFGNVEYLQSSVLGKLVNLNRKITPEVGRLILCNLRPSVHKVFVITRLEQIFTIEPTPV